MEMGANQVSPSYYSLLGVSTNSSVEDIRRAYRKLAMRWHPDRWARTPSLLGEAKRKFQQIQEAYSVLSDQGKRTLYDAGLYDAEDENDEGLSDFVQELVSLMGQVRREDKIYSMEELQTMFMEMAQGFESSSPWFCGTSVFEDSGRAKRSRLDKTNLMADRHSGFSVSGISRFGRSSYCS